MIELLLQADGALAMGLVDQAERLYRQASDADPLNSIAVVGLARVALERADQEGALREARRALAIDPENVAASRLALRLEEVLAYRGQVVPPATVGPVTAEAAGVGATAVEPMAVEAAAEPTAAPAAEEPAAEPTAVEPIPVEPTTVERVPVEHDPGPGLTAAPRRRLLDRLFRRNRP